MNKSRISNGAYKMLPAVLLAAVFFLGGPVFAGPEGGIAKMEPFSSRLPVRMSGWVVHEGDLAGAESADFDDSGWAAASPGYTWQERNTSRWFRAKFTVPADLAGKTLVFEAAMDDAGAIFVDGEKKTEFSGSGSALLASAPEAGRVITIAVRGDNHGGIGSFTFAGYRVLADGALVEISSAMSSLAPLRNINVSPVGDWKFKIKGGKKPASPDTDVSNWENAGSSHRWSSTDPVCWYRTEFTMPETVNGFPVDKGPVELVFSVEDVADIYVNGKRMQSIEGTGALDITGKLQPGKTVTLAVKVSRLEGSGGLRGVSLHAAALDPVKEKVEKFLAGWETARLFMEQHPNPPEGAGKAVAAAVAAVREMESKKDNAASLEEVITRGLDELSAIDGYLAEYPLFRFGPYLQNSKKDGMTIMWETQVPADSTVYYGIGNLEGKVHDPELKTIHEVVITGLEEETEYSYMAVSGKLAAPESVFRTSIRRDTPFKYAVWGDNRTDSASHESVIDRMIMSDPDIALSVGDVVTNGSVYSQWGNEYFLPIRRLGIDTPTYIAIGNHEYGGYGCGNPVEWFEKFVSHPAPGDYYFSFTYGNSIFIALNPQETAACYDVAPGTEQYQWLVGVLESEEYKNSDFRFVFLHEPPYSECWSGGYYDGEARLRRNLVPLMEKYKVDIVYAGHTHDYERGQWPAGDGPYYIITGGGGASLDDTKYKEWPQIDMYAFEYHFVLVTIERKKLRFEAVKPNGELLDSFEINKN